MCFNVDIDLTNSKLAVMNQGGEVGYDADIIEFDACIWTIGVANSF